MWKSYSLAWHNDHGRTRTYLFKKLNYPCSQPQHSHRLYFHLYQNKFRKIVPQFHWERYDKYLQGYMVGGQTVEGGLTGALLKNADESVLYIWNFLHIQTWILTSSPPSRMHDAIAVGWPSLCEALQHFSDESNASEALFQSLCLVLGADDDRNR